ncbi:MAG: helix-turn-helix domain-containing protein [Myxococcota bacterium]
MHALEIPSDETTRVAGEAVRAFSAAGGRRPTLVEVVAEGDGSTRVTVPVEAFELLMEVLAHLANGHGVTVMPVKAELTTQQAADLLNVSRPFLIKLLDGGELPFRKVGTHRRVRVEDVVAYKELDDTRRRAAADALVAEAEELGLGY